jgi:hypothetical protein
MGLHRLEGVRREGRVKIEVREERSKEDYIREFHIVG